MSTPLTSKTNRQALADTVKQNEALGQEIRKLQTRCKEHEVQIANLNEAIKECSVENDYLKKKLTEKT